jgi:hypothetical protein
MFRGLLALGCLCAAARADVATVTQPLSVHLGPLGKIAVPAQVSLLRTPIAFSPFSGTLPLRFRVRSTEGGGGTITLQVTSDFLPAGGPSVRDGVLSYLCSGADLGTACSGSQVAQAGLQTPVLVLPPAACTGGGMGCSAADPASMEIHFTLENSPTYQTGTYSAQITFVISAL